MRACVPSSHAPGSLEHFAENVRRRLRAGRLTLSELSERCGLTQERLRRVVFGADLPELDELARIAEALGADPADLLSEPP